MTLVSRNAEKIGISMAVSLALCASAAAQVTPHCTTKADGTLTDEFRKMVVITDETVFNSGKFSFKDTISRMLQTSIDVKPGDPDAQKKLDAVSTPKAQRELVATLLDSFWETTRVNREGIVNNATQRPNEAALTPEQLLKDLHPVALFNRLDLVPRSYDHCGEHRIVYALGEGQQNNRFFLIFEAAVDNPDPQNSVAGCVRIAKFWQGLSSKTGIVLIDALKGFYSFGELGDGGPPAAPVVHNQHYGVPFGQVRGNLFMAGGDVAGNPWMLREWRSQPTATGTSFVVDTIKSNPVPEFYDAVPIATDGSDHGRRQRFADLRPEFQRRFSLSNVRELIDVDLEAAARNGQPPSAVELINRLGVLFDDRFNDFESISQDSDIDDITTTPATTLWQDIEKELKNYRLPSSWNLTPDHILARAEALSCAGCHRLTVGQEIAPSINWPAERSFVHVDEKSEVSPALEQKFLPWRCNALLKFIEDNQYALTAAAAPAADAVSEAEYRGDAAAVRDVQKDFREKAFAASEAQRGDPVNEAAAKAQADAALSDLLEAVETVRQGSTGKTGEFRVGGRTH